MTIDIKRLSPGLADDYVRFFDQTPHDDNTEEGKCYCVCWCSADHRMQTDFSSPQKRRALALQYVRDGVLQGYLAYCEGQVVGWCNANTKADCLHCISWLRSRQAVEANPAERVKSIYCFVIAPAMQRMGIAAALTERVCADAAADGFDCVEAYPQRAFVSVAGDFTGPAAMYRRLGFTVHAQAEKDRVVVRKPLR